MFIVILIFIFIAVGMVWYLLAHDRGAKEPVGALWVAAGFGLLAVAAAIVLESFLIPPGLIAGTLPLGTALIAALGVGVIEETVKFVPLAGFIYRRSYFNEHTDGIIYFGICGLTFGLLENVFYTIQFGAQTGIARILLVPFLHCATTGTAGYYLARAKLDQRSLGGVAVAVAGLAGLHGLYDFGLASRMPALIILSLMITLLLSTGLFLFYMQAGDLDRRQGLSAVGHNNFCRFCGRANAGHTLYCQFCGQPA